MPERERICLTDIESPPDKLDRYARLVETHFHYSVLQSLPEQQRTLDDATAFMPSMSMSFPFSA